MKEDISIAVLENDNLQKRIWMKRKKMIQIANQKGLSSLETIKQSQELDALIYEYLCQQE